MNRWLPYAFSRPTRTCGTQGGTRIVAPDQGDDEMPMGFELSPEEVETFTSELARLREEHRDLDSASSLARVAISATRPMLRMVLRL